MQTLHCLLYPDRNCMRLLRILLNKLYEKDSSVTIDFLLDWCRMLNKSLIRVSCNKSEVSSLFFNTNELKTKYKERRPPFFKKFSKFDEICAGNKNH